jgi:hypothetical protein
LESLGEKKALDQASSTNYNFAKTIDNVVFANYFFLQCCLGLTTCELGEISPLDYKHGMLNADLFSVPACTCMQDFLHCLQSVGSEVTFCLCFIKYSIAQTDNSPFD